MFEIQPEYQIDVTEPGIWGTRTLTLDNIQWYKGGKVLTYEVYSILELKNIKDVDSGEHRAKRENEDYLIIT